MRTSKFSPTQIAKIPKEFEHGAHSTKMPMLGTHILPIHETLTIN